jgi:hypothetical protein
MSTPDMFGHYQEDPNPDDVLLPEYIDFQMRASKTVTIMARMYSALNKPGPYANVTWAGGLLSDAQHWHAITHIPSFLGGVPEEHDEALAACDHFHKHVMISMSSHMN